MKKTKIIILCSLTAFLSTFFGIKGGKSINRSIFLLDKVNKAILSEKENPSLDNQTVAELALSEINSISSNKNYYKIKEFHEVVDFDNNKYLYINFEPYGLSVISLENYCTVEIKPFSKENFESSEYYLPKEGLITCENGIYKSVKTKNTVDFGFLNHYSKKLSASLHKTENLKNNLSNKKETLLHNTNKITTLASGDDNPYNSIDVDKQLVTADIEVPHSWFFKYNQTQFPYANPVTNGICEYIAYIMLVEYNDFFKAKGYFSDEEVSKYISTVKSTNYIGAIPDVHDNLAYDLFVKNNRKETLSADDLNSLSNLFLKNKPIKYNNVHAYWLFGNPVNVIKSGRPDMLCGNFPDWQGKKKGHNIVAYGYFSSGTYKGKYLTHYGWDYDTQCLVDREVFASAYDWSLEDKTVNPENRYIFDINGKLECGKFLP